MAVSEQPEVRVAFKRIWDLVEEGRSDIPLVFRPSDASRWSYLEYPAGLAAVDAARLRANDGSPEEGTAIFSVSPSPYGPVMVLDDPGDWEQARDWFTTFATALAEAGWSGTVEPSEAERDLPTWLEMGRAPVEKLTAFTALTLSAPYPTPSTSPRWGVAPVTTEAVCRRAVAWCSAVPDAKVYLFQGRSRVVLEDPQSPSILAATAERDLHSGTWYVRDQPIAVRTFDLSDWGQACYVIDEEELSWRARLDSLLQILLSEAANLDSAMVRLVPGWPFSWMGLQRGNPVLPRVSEGDVRGNRQLWDRLVPDAHGAQILTSAHLASAHNLDAWEVRKVAPDRYLVLAADLTPWYSRSAPDPEVVAAARDDFGAMILTPEAIRENTPYR